MSDLPYKNLGHRAYHFTDSNRAEARRKKALGRPAVEDPPCIVECSRCSERVWAKDGRYWDTLDALVPVGGPSFVPHRHQPEKAPLPKQPYGINGARS